MRPLGRSFVAMLVATTLLVAPRWSLSQVAAPGTFRLTEYWVASESQYGSDRHAARLADRSGATLAWACERFASALALEGTGRSWDGRLLNWEARQGSRVCFSEVDTAIYPYGVGVRDYALVPYRSLAVDGRFIPLGHTVEIAELIGLPMPDGSLHDGCFVAVDGGGAIRGHHIDLFVPSREAWSELGHQGLLPERVHPSVDVARCSHALRFAVLPLPGDPIGLVTGSSGAPNGRRVLHVRIPPEG